MRAALRAVAVVLRLALGGAAAAGEFEVPAGYRLEPYRAPVPRTLAGATTLDTASAERLWREGNAIFVDVMYRDVRPPNLPAGTVWRQRRRDNIPGSIWLVNVGYGALGEQMENYFRRSLEDLTAGDRDRPLVFYCLMDCWMSWNAARRAVALGYAGVHWYPEGTDGWAAAGLPLAEAHPHH
jgi:PQQ-dependent catabolism-associated CXXCW motif protein